MYRVVRLHWTKNKLVEKNPKRSSPDSHWHNAIRFFRNLYRECGWVTLDERRKQHKLIFMYKTVHWLVPPYISDIKPPLVHEITDYPLRNQNNITVPFCKTEHYRRSCIPSSIALWKIFMKTYGLHHQFPVLNTNWKKSQNNSKVPSFFLTGNRFYR